MVWPCPNRSCVHGPCSAWLSSGRCCSQSWYAFGSVLAEKVFARSRFCGRLLCTTGSRPCQKQGPYNGPCFGTAYMFFNKRSQNRDRFSAPVLDQLLPLKRFLALLVAARSFAPWGAVVGFLRFSPPLLRGQWGASYRICSRSSRGRCPRARVPPRPPRTLGGHRLRRCLEAGNRSGFLDRH